MEGEEWVAWSMKPGWNLSNKLNSSKMNSIQ